MFFSIFSSVLDWIVLILVWFERSLYSAQVSRQSCPWPLKLMTSKRVERTWIRTGGYRRFRGEWVNYSLHCLSVLCSCTFRSATFLHRTQISHCLPWVPEVSSRVRRGASFFSAAGRPVFGRRPKTRAAKRGSLFKTWPRPETAHEKPLAPCRVHFVLQYAEKWDRWIVCQTTPPPLIFRFCFLIIRFRSCFCDVDWWWILFLIQNSRRLSETSAEKRNIPWWLIRK